MLKYYLLMQDLKKLIEDAWEDRKLLQYNEYINAIDAVIEKLDKGKLRVAELIGTRWHTNDWIKKSGDPLFPNQANEGDRSRPLCIS